MNFKKTLLLSLGGFTLLGLMSRFTTNIPSELDVQSISTNANIRIFVVRPSWWDGNGTNTSQLLRTANSATGLNTRDLNDGYQTFPISGFTSDSYYDNSTTGSGTFNEYEADGIVFYELPYSAIDGKWFDLVRINPSDPNDVWNDVGNIQFSAGMNHRILRIWGDGGGLVTNISGASAESRNIANTSLVPILTGYLTCSNNTYNGYGAYADLRDNFNLEGRDGLSSVSITDFTFTNTDGVISYDYSTSENRSVSTTVQAKVDRMKSISGN
jgi:hypothetical protein